MVAGRWNEGFECQGNWRRPAMYRLGILFMSMVFIAITSRKMYLVDLMVL
jgi:hypothetical protein